MSKARTVRLAYHLDGTRVPYKSTKANVRLRLEGNDGTGWSSDDIQYQGLPVMSYSDGDGERSMPYIPDSLDRRIKEDIRKLGKPFHLSLVFLHSELPFSKTATRKYIAITRAYYIPPVTDGALLSRIIR